MAESGIEGIRRLLASKPRPVGWAERRARIVEVGNAWPPEADIRFSKVDVDGMPGEWSLSPECDRNSVLLYFHGGGYCSGSIASHRRLVSEAGRAAGIRTLAVEYRLAPEHPFPAAYDDALKAWRWLLAQDLSPSQIVVGGDSAGAGLAIALLVRLRDAREALPGGAWLVSPWTDLAMTGVTLATKESVDPLIHKAYLEELATAVVPVGMDRKDPRISVLYADLRNLPPMLIQVGAAETLLDDAVRFAGAAGAADIPVSLQVWPRMIHAFPLWNGGLAEGRAALAGAGAFLRANTAPRATVH